MWSPSGRVKKEGSVKAWRGWELIHLTAAGAVNTSLEAQSHTAAFCTKHRWKKGEFLPQTTSNLSVRCKYPLIATHGIRGGEPPVYIRAVHPLAAPALLVRSAPPVMTSRVIIPFLGPLQLPPCCRKQEEAGGIQSACDRLPAEDGELRRSSPRAQSPGALRMELPPELGQRTGIRCLESHFPVRINNLTTIAQFLAPRPHLNVGQWRPTINI